MLDADIGDAVVSSLLNPGVITTTTASPSGYWQDLSQYKGYCLFTVSLGTITATSVQVQLQSSASFTGSAPASGGAAAQFPLVLAAGSPAQQTLCLPASCSNRYVGTRRSLQARAMFRSRSRWQALRKFHVPREHRDIPRGLRRAGIVHAAGR